MLASAGELHADEPPPATVVGRVPDEPNEWLLVELFLRAIPAVQEHTTGVTAARASGRRKMFVDWAGATVPLYDAGNGDVVERASIFGAALGAPGVIRSPSPLDSKICIPGSIAICGRLISSPAVPFW
jgi:hypothetical protein